MPPAYGELWKSIFDGIFFVSSFLLITRGGGGGSKQGDVVLDISATIHTVKKHLMYLVIHSLF